MKRLAAFASLLLITGTVMGQVYPIHLMEEGHIMVGVTINDSISGNFILDTGAGIMVVSGKMYQRIQGHVEPAGYHTGFRHDGDKISGEIYTVPSFAIGGVKVENLKAGVYPPLDTFGIDGLMSLKFFEKKPFTIDYANRKLVFEDQESLNVLAEKGESGPLQFHRNLDVSLDMALQVCINNKVYIQAQFDTGSGHDLYVLHPHFMSSLGLDVSKARASTYVTPISGTQLNDLITSNNDMSICSTSASIDADIVFREGLIMEALIGSGIFKEGAITIDIPESRFIFNK